MLRQIKRAGLVLAIGLVALAPALARGPGNFSVKGKAGSAGGAYTGSSSLTQTSADTWSIIWKIGGQTWTGYGIGDGKVIALNFTGNGSTGVMLLVAKDDGTGYNAAWSYTGEKKVGYEDWTK